MNVKKKKNVKYSFRFCFNKAQHYISKGNVRLADKWHYRALTIG